MPHLTDALRDAIARDGRSLRTIADEARVSVGFLSRFVRGQLGCSVENAERLAEALGLRIELRRANGRRV